MQKDTFPQADGKFLISTENKGCYDCHKTGTTLYPIERVRKGVAVTDYICTDCIKKNDIVVAQEEERVRCEYMMDRYRTISDVPKIFEKSKFDDFCIKSDGYYTKKYINRMRTVKEDVLRVCESVVAGESRMSIFSGDFGTGKTMLACCCINELINRGRPARFYHASVLIRKMMDNTIYHDVLFQMSENDLIVIDDIHQAAASEFTKRTMSDIIDMLYINERSLIITGNCSKKDWVEKYIGERGNDRFEEYPDNYICFEWLSYRGRKV